MLKAKYDWIVFIKGTSRYVYGLRGVNIDKEIFIREIQLMGTLKVWIDNPLALLEKGIEVKLYQDGDVLLKHKNKIKKLSRGRFI